MRLEQYPFVASPNFFGRGGLVPEGTVIHYTAGGGALGTARWFSKREARVSAHFVVGRDGTVIQCVELDKKAWHAGASEMAYRGETRSDVNRFTIGIEMANRGYLQKGDDGRFHYESGRRLKVYRGPDPVHAILRYDSGHQFEGWWEPWPGLQIAALKFLLSLIAEAGYERAARTLVGHEEIGMPLGRKKDPGPLFPWEDLGRFGDRRTEGVFIEA